MHCPGISLLCSSFLSARFPTKLSSPVGAGRAAPSQQPLAATGYFRGRGKLGRSPADRLSRSAPGGSRAGSPSHACRCLLPRQRRRRMRMVDSTQVTKPERRVPEPRKGRCEAAGLAWLLRGCFHSCKNLLRSRFGVSSLPAPPAERSQGAAVQGFWFRPISQKFCHHAVHHARCRIRITQRMAPGQHLLKSVEKPSLAMMGAGSGRIRSDRYHGAREVVLTWEYLVAPKLLLETDRAACLQSGCCSGKLPTLQQLFNEHLTNRHRYLIHVLRMQGNRSGFQLRTSSDAHKTS